MTRVFRLIATTFLALTVATFAIANCLPTEMGAADQRACCVKGEPDCGPSMQASNCCATSNGTQPTLMGAKPTAPAKPLLMATVTPAGDVTPLSVSNISSPRSAVLTASSPPLFLLASSLRI